MNTTSSFWDQDDEHSPILRNNNNNDDDLSQMNSSSATVPYSPFCESVVKIGKRVDTSSTTNASSNVSDTNSVISHFGATTTTTMKKASSNKKKDDDEDSVYLKKALRRKKVSIEEAELGLDPNEGPPVLEALTEYPPTEMVASLVPCSAIEYLREILDDGLEPDDFVECLFDVFKDAYPQYLDNGNERLEDRCKSQIRIFFTEVDANDNGDVDWEEFSTHLLVNTRGAPTDKPSRAMERSLLQVERDSGYDPPPPGRKMSVFHLNTQSMHAIRFMRGGPPPALYSPSWGCHIIAQDRNVEFGIASEVELSCYKLNTTTTPSHPLASAHLMTVNERAGLHRKLELVAHSVIPQRICAMEPLDEQSYALGSDGSLITNQRRPHLAATTADDRLLYIELADDPLTLMTKGYGQLRVVRNQYLQGKHNILRWNPTGRTLFAVDTRGKVKLIDPSDTSSAMPKEKLSFYGGGPPPSNLGVNGGSVHHHSKNNNHNASSSAASSGGGGSMMNNLRSLSPKSRLKAKKQILKKVSSYPIRGGSSLMMNSNNNINNDGDHDHDDQNDHFNNHHQNTSHNVTGGATGGGGAVLDLVTMPEMASCDKIIVAGSDAIRMFDTARGGEVLHHLGEKIYATKLAYSAETSIVAACVAEDTDIHLLSPHSAGKSAYVRSLHDPIMQSGTLRAFPKQVIALDGTPYLTSYDTAGVVRLWDLRSSVPVCSFRSTGEDSALYVDTAETLPLCMTRGISVDPVRFEMATVSRTVDGTRQDSFRMKLTDARDPLDAHDSDLLSVEFIEDMHQIASLANDDTLHFWDGQSTVLRRRIKEFVNGDGETATVPGKLRRPVTACCIELPNGRRTMIGLATGEVIMYSIVTRCEIAEFTSHKGQVVDLSLTLSERLISAGADGVIYISSTSEELDYRIYATINLDNPVVQLSADPICQLIFALDSSCKFYQVDADPDGAYSLLSASRAIHAPSATASASMYSSKNGGKNNSDTTNSNNNSSNNQRPDTAGTNNTNTTSAISTSRSTHNNNNLNTQRSTTSNNNNNNNNNNRHHHQQQDNSSNALETEYLNPTNFEGTCCTICSPRAAAVVADARGYLSVIPTRPSSRHGELYLCRWRSHSSDGGSKGGGTGGDIRGATLSVPTKLIYVEKELALYVGDDQGNVSVYFMRGTWCTGKIGVVQSMFGIEDGSVPNPSHTDPPMIQDEFASRPKLLRHFPVTEDKLPISTMAFVESKDLLIVASRTKIRLARPLTGEILGDVVQGRCVSFESFAGLIDLGEAPERSDDDDEDYYYGDGAFDDDEELEEYQEEVEQEVDEEVRDPMASLEHKMRMKNKQVTENNNGNDQNENGDDQLAEIKNTITIQVKKKVLITVRKPKKRTGKGKRRRLVKKKRTGSSSNILDQHLGHEAADSSSAGGSRPQSSTGGNSTSRSVNNNNPFGKSSTSASASASTAMMMSGSFSLQKFNASVRRMSRSTNADLASQLNAKEEILKKEFEEMLSSGGAPETFVAISRDQWEQNANQLRPYAFTMKGCGEIDLKSAKTAEAAAAKVSISQVKSPRTSPTRANQYKKNTHRVGLMTKKAEAGAGVHRSSDGSKPSSDQQQNNNNRDHSLIAGTDNFYGSFVIPPSSSYQQVDDDDDTTDDNEDDYNDENNNNNNNDEKNRRYSNIDAIESDNDSSSSRTSDHQNRQHEKLLKPTFASFAAPRSSSSSSPEKKNNNNQKTPSTTTSEGFKLMTSPSLNAVLASGNNKSQSTIIRNNGIMTSASFINNTNNRSLTMNSSSGKSFKQQNNSSNSNNGSLIMTGSSFANNTNNGSFIAGGGVITSNSNAFGTNNENNTHSNIFDDPEQQKFMSMLNKVSAALQEELSRDGVSEKAKKDDFWWNSDPLYRTRTERHQEYQEEMNALRSEDDKNNNKFVDPDDDDDDFDFGGSDDDSNSNKSNITSNSSSLARTDNNSNNNVFGTKRGPSSLFPVFGGSTNNNYNLSTMNENNEAAAIVSPTKKEQQQQQPTSPFRDFSMSMSATTPPSGPTSSKPSFSHQQKKNDTSNLTSPVMTVLFSGTLPYYDNKDNNNNNQDNDNIINNINDEPDSPLISLPPALEKTTTKTFGENNDDGGETTKKGNSNKETASSSSPPMATFKAFDWGGDENDNNDNTSHNNKDDLKSQSSFSLGGSPTTSGATRAAAAAVGRGGITFSEEQQQQEEERDREGNENNDDHDATDDATNTPVSPQQQQHPNNNSSSNLRRKTSSFGSFNNNNKTTKEDPSSSKTTPLLLTKKLSRRKSSFSASTLQQSKADQIVVFRRPLLYPLGKPREATINAVVNGTTNYSSSGGWIDRLEATIAESGLSNPQLPSRDVIKQIRTFASAGKLMTRMKNRNDNNDSSDLADEDPRIWVVPKSSIIEVEHDAHRFDFFAMKRATQQSQHDNKKLNRDQQQRRQQEADFGAMMVLEDSTNNNKKNSSSSVSPRRKSSTSPSPPTSPSRNNKNNNSKSPTTNTMSASSSKRHHHNHHRSARTKKQNNVLKRVRFQQHKDDSSSVSPDNKKRQQKRETTTSTSPNRRSPSNNSSNNIDNNDQEQQQQKLKLSQSSSTNKSSEMTTTTKPEHFGDAEWEIFLELDQKMKEVKQSTEHRIKGQKEREESQMRLEECRSTTFASFSSASNVFNNSSQSDFGNSGNLSDVDDGFGVITTPKAKADFSSIKLPSALRQQQEQQQEHMTPPPQKQMMTSMVGDIKSSLSSFSPTKRLTTTTGASSSSLQHPSKTPPPSLRVLSSVLESRTMSASEKKRRTGILKFIPEADLIDAEEKEKKELLVVKPKSSMKTNVNTSNNDDDDEYHHEDHHNKSTLLKSNTNSISSSSVSSSPLIAFRSRVGQSVPPAGMPSAPKELFTMPMSIEQEVTKKEFSGWNEAKKGKLSERAAFYDNNNNNNNNTSSKNGGDVSFSHQENNNKGVVKTRRGPKVSLAKR